MTGQQWIVSACHRVWSLLCVISQAGEVEKVATEAEYEEKLSQSKSKSKVQSQKSKVKSPKDLE